ncbi:hypothetical protein BDV96DRAFT_661037 [Lophiotrema nucula]|uniref:Lysine-specific metallo-endopeptidase domain-containing protein n=1 Tax=Lophiotrema nucula TaxID=690887 RepID=A0A6A5Z8B4_9PLEO|nr:hypothetical protein BDV96DRAFT_661037 [Lophiotrema nucula]
MVNIVCFNLLFLFTSSLLVHGYIIDFTCEYDYTDCGAVIENANHCGAGYSFLEKSVDSAFSLANNAYRMLHAAQMDTGNTSPATPAVKALAKNMFGSEDGAWTALNTDSQFSPKDAYQQIYLLAVDRRIKYEQNDPPVKIVEENGIKKPEIGWAQKTNDLFQSVIYCDVKNWTPVTEGDAKAKTSKKGWTNACVPNRKFSQIQDHTMAFTLVKESDESVTYPAAVSQMVLCPWFLIKSKEKGQTRVEQLKSKFDQFKGDRKARAQGIGGMLKVLFNEAKPEIEKYMPLDYLILHEFSHMPQYGRTKDVDPKKCYGWRNCSKLGSTAIGQNNADTLALFALALWFLSEDVYVTENGNLVPSVDSLKDCLTPGPVLYDATKKQDAKWEQQAQQEGVAQVIVKEEPSSSKGDTKLFPNYEFRRDDEA